MDIKLLKRIARQILKPFLRFKKFDMRPNDMSRDALVSLLEKAGVTDGVMVEIGSYQGESAEVFLKSGRIRKIYCVDPWQMYYDPDDGAAFTDMARVEADFDRRLAGDARVVKVKGTIDTFVGKYADVFKEIDLVYVDGLHTYEGVKYDIETIMKHFRPRVALAGHDFSDAWPGSKRAVRETLGEPDAVLPDTSWLKLMH